MKLNYAAATVAFVLFALSGCNKDNDAKPEALAASATKPAAASPANAGLPAGVKPGSFEDWCDEHQVPKSLDTKCNPSLAPAFKASGDWCKEHDMPESQCSCDPKHKPVRPPRT
jgi:hypothetical protein